MNIHLSVTFATVRVCLEASSSLPGGESSHYETGWAVQIAMASRRRCYYSVFTLVHKPSGERVVFWYSTKGKNNGTDGFLKVLVRPWHSIAILLLLMRYARTHTCYAAERWMVRDVLASTTGETRLIQRLSVYSLAVVPPRRQQRYDTPRPNERPARDHHC